MEDTPRSQTISTQSQEIAQKVAHATAEKQTGAFTRKETVIRRA